MSDAPQARPEDATVEELGEFELIDALTAAFEQGEQVLVGPGDDAAVLRIRTGHVVVSTDMLVEGRHFRRDWVPARDVGHRAAAQNLSDINAMGGRAHSLTVGMAVPADLPVAWATEFAEGFAEECRAVGASVVGGDLTRGDQLVVSVTVLGACTVAPVLRSGAEPGDVLALAGRQGWAAGGLAVLGRGFRSPRVLVEAYRRPAPPYDAGPEAAAAGATSMIDVSDGLLSEAGHLARASGVRIDVRTGTLEVPGAAARGGRGDRVRPAALRARRGRRPRPPGDLRRRRERAGGLDRDRRGHRGGGRHRGRRPLRRAGRLDGLLRPLSEVAAGDEGRRPGTEEDRHPSR